MAFKLIGIFSLDNKANSFMMNFLLVCFIIVDQLRYVYFVSNGVVTALVGLRDF